MLDPDSITLTKTSPACPEQYDMFDADGTQVGYIRLRHGSFSVRAHDPSGPVVVERAFPLDEAAVLEPEEQGLPRHCSEGIFEDGQVRDAYLSMAKRKVAEYLAR